jgi:predicted DNA-binding transcriptional regulator YafY
LPKDFSLDDFMRHSFKVMHDEGYTVKVRISRGWARWVGEKICHESQKAKKNGDGSLELTFRVAGLDEIKRWVLSFGPKAQVLDPSRLRQMVCTDLRNCLGQYVPRRTSFDLIRESQA